MFGNEAAYPLVSSYSVAELGIEPTTWTTAQGPDGVLYFGGDSLISFDGEKWRRTSINGAYALRGLDFSKDGRLWAAAAGEIGWFDRQSSGDWTYHSLVQKLPSGESRLGEVWNVFAEKTGVVFVSTNKVFRWNGNSFQSWSFPGEHRIMASRSAGVVYVHHFPTGLHAITADGPKLIIPASLLGRSGVLWLESSPEGLLLVTSKGLFSYANGEIAPLAAAASEYLRQNILTSATRLPDGRLVLGTYRGGLAVLRSDGTVSQIIDEKNGLPTPVIFSLYSDREKNLWINSDSQILRVSIDSLNAIFDRRHGLPTQPLQMVARYQQQIVVGTENGLFEFQPRVNQFQPIAINTDHISDVESDSDGLLVSGHGGVRRLEGGKTSVFYSAQAAAFVAKPSRQLKGNVLISILNSIVLLNPDGISRTLVNNLPDIVTSIAEDKQGRLWLGTTARAILVAKPSHSESVEAISVGPNYGLPDGIGPGRVVALTDGTVIAFCHSGAWFLRPDGSRFTAVEEYPVRSANAVSEVAADKSLWIVHPASDNRAACVARIAVEDGRATWRPHSVEGLWNIGIPKSILAETGPHGETVLWIGGTNGLLRHVVAGGPVAPTPRPPLVRALARTADSAALQPIGTTPLPYSTEAVVFEFAAPEFARRPSLRLETMLDGVDQRWVPADPSSRREFTPLRGGRYDFRVRAVAETGVVGPATVAHVEITPPWWRTAPALFFGLTALGPAGYGAYRWRVRTLRRRNAELEARIRVRTAELARANAAKTQFVANVSHDIRNPLNGIAGLALTLENSPLNARQSEAVATLRECTNYLTTLVDDVLDFAAIEAGEVELRPGPFSPAEVLRSVAAMFKLEAMTGGASLAVETAADLPATCIGDAGRIQQILVNFLANALKYSGGCIRLVALVPPEAPGQIEFAVADDGPGIGADGQKLLFTKFSRLSGPETKAVAGTGLGLASCRLLAGMMDGSVGVLSGPGQGARFHLRLPLVIAPHDAPTAARNELPAPLLPNCTVLLVEDTDYNALAAAAVLDQFGVACDRAATGAAALELFTEKHHDLVLLDRNLPDMDGADVARRIRAMEANGPRTIMLAVTAYCTSEERGICLGAGMNGFVGKPLTPEKLRRVLSEVGRHLLVAPSHS